MSLGANRMIGLGKVFGLAYDKRQGLLQDNVVAYQWLNLAAMHAPDSRVDPQSRRLSRRERDHVAVSVAPSGFTSQRR